MDPARAEESRTQVDRLESEIESLRSGHKGIYERRYAEFFAHAKTISELFKSSRTIFAGERERLWADFQTVCDEVRQESDRGREAHINNSRVKRSVIESDIREVYYWAKGANHVADLQEAERRLQLVNERLKDGWSGFTGTTEFFESIAGNDGRLTKEDRNLLWDKWREAKDEIRNRRALLCELHFDHMRGIAGECLSLAHSDPRAAKERIKRANQEMKQHALDRDQYAHIRENLDEAWNLASQTASSRHREWRERMEDHVERWLELHRKNESVIASLEEQVERCEEMESSARSSEFAERVRGWIEEKLDKVRDIRRTNQELEERIESAKGKLGK